MKVVVWGLGKVFKKNITFYKQLFDIIAITDSKVYESYKGIPYIMPEQILYQSFDKIIISSTSYYRLIKTQLLKIGIPEDKIISCEEALRELDMQKYEQDMKLYQEAYQKYSSELEQRNFCINSNYNFPILSDWRSEAGNLGEYFWQDLWAANRIIENNPENHYDIGSRLDGFIAHLLCNKVKVTMIDIRPLTAKVPLLDFVQSDATNLKGIMDNSICSLSALCSLEHFGLGRYGDAINPDACFEAFKSIQRVMRKKGRIYISLPVGKEHIEFNAHRIFYPSTIVAAFSEMRLVEFSTVDLCDPVEPLKCEVDLDKYDHENCAKTGLFIFEK